MLNKLYILLLQLPIGSRNLDDNSVDFTSTFDVIVFIVLPVLMIIFYIFWKRRKKNDKD